MSKLLAREALGPHRSCPGIQPVSRCRPLRLLPSQVGSIYFWILIGSPLGSVSSSTRKPSGPAAMLVGIPGKICPRRGWDDLLRLLLWKRSICVLGQWGDRGCGATAPHPILLRVGAVTKRVSFNVRINRKASEIEDRVGLSCSPNNLRPLT